MIKAQLRGEPRPVVASELDEQTWLDLRTASSRTRYVGGQVRLFSCVDCRQPVHPKQSTERGTRWFAHNPGPHGGCALAVVGGESPEHVRIKTSIYKAAKRVAKWDAEVEVPTGDLDPDTGRPAVVDVVAMRQGIAYPKRDDRRVFEVQLSSLNVGDLLNRQEIRERFASRSIWVTTKRFQWAEQVPWYQIEAKTEQHPDLVVDGVLAQDDASGECSLVPPFEADRMAGLIIGQRMPWIGDLGGFILNYGVRSGRIPKRSSKRPSKRSRVAGWCDRPVVPDELADPCSVCNRPSWASDYSGRPLCRAHFRVAGHWIERYGVLPTNWELLVGSDGP